MSSDFLTLEEAINAVIIYYQKLEKLEPKDDLLKYLEDVTERGFRHVSKLERKFFDKFDRGRLVDMAYVRMEIVYEKYSKALERRCNSLKNSSREREP